MQELVGILTNLIDYYRSHLDDLRACFAYRNIWLEDAWDLLYSKPLSNPVYDQIMDYTEDLPVYFRNDIMELILEKLIGTWEYAHHRNRHYFSMTPEDNLEYAYLDSLGFSSRVVNRFVQVEMGSRREDQNYRLKDIEIMRYMHGCCSRPVDIVEGVRYKVRLTGYEKCIVVFSGGNVSLYYADTVLSKDVIKSDALSMFVSIMDYLGRRDECSNVGGYYELVELYRVFIKAGTIDNSVPLFARNVSLSGSDILTVNHFMMNGNMVQAEVLLREKCASNIKSWYRANKTEFLQRLMIGYNRWKKKGKLPINYYRLASVYTIAPSILRVILELKVESKDVLCSEEEV